MSSAVLEVNWGGGGGHFMRLSLAMMLVQCGVGWSSVGLSLN
jgi:hypothetical protein